jgi:SAM-dependent methyltransferase
MGRSRRRQRRRPGRDRQRARQQQAAIARETLERDWYSRIDFAPELTALVTHQAARAEPLHRWLPYRQGFAPELVRRFLASAELVPGPVLDPFAGSGTTVIECARQGRFAVGVEPLASLALLAAVRCRAVAPGALQLTPRPEESLAGAMERAGSPAEKAAVLAAAARTVKGDGKPRRNAPPPAELLAETLQLIREDADTPLPAPGRVLRGDALALPLADGSVGGVLTSPPYLSRYDYTRVNEPLETLLRGPAAGAAARRRQVRAHPRARRRTWLREPHPAVAECAEQLHRQNRDRLAGVVQSYHDDLGQALSQIARALRPGAPLTMVIAGAHLGGEYMPADLVACDICRAVGLEVEEILRVRTFGSGRRLGTLDDVAPREVILSARRPAEA